VTRTPARISLGTSTVSGASMSSLLSTWWVVSFVMFNLLVLQARCDGHPLHQADCKRRATQASPGFEAAA
jgi:hypothetical protein